MTDLTWYTEDGHVSNPSASDMQIHSLFNESYEALGGTSSSRTTIAATVLGVNDVHDLVIQTVYPPGDSNTEFIRYMKASDAPTDGSWHPHEDEYIENAAQWVRNREKNAKTQTPEPSNEPITPPAPPSGSSSSTGKGISALVQIGEDWVSDDTISINTSQVGSLKEAGEPSTCTVVLHNGGQKYGKKISGGDWRPRQTQVWAISDIDKHMGNGVVEKVNDPIFIGVLVNAKYNEEVATIECECADSIMGSSYDDIAWQSDAIFPEKMQAIVDAVNDSSDAAQIHLIDYTTSDNFVKRRDWVPSSLSALESMKQVSQLDKKDFFVASDMLEQNIVVLIDGDTIIGQRDLEPYVEEPGDTSSIIGYVTRVEVINDNNLVPMTMSNVPDQQADNARGLAVDDEGAAQYGEIQAYIIRDPSNSSSAQDLADEAKEQFKEFKDRTIKARVVNIIPFLRSAITYQVPDVLGTGNPISIQAKLMSKQVEYSSGGIVTSLEAARIHAVADEASKPAEPQFESLMTNVVMDQYGNGYYMRRDTSGVWSTWISRASMGTEDPGGENQIDINTLWSELRTQLEQAKIDALNKASGGK